MTSIRLYLEEGILPEDPIDVRTLMEKIGKYTMEDGFLYRKSYLVSLMRCVGPLQANYAIREVHMGSCGGHEYGILLALYAYWKRILKKKTKTKPKTTKPSKEWKRSKKTKSFEAKSQKSKPEVNKSQPRESQSQTRQSRSRNAKNNEI
nr:hypothetical protein [Tanacetum cinerariifolium]